MAESRNLSSVSVSRHLEFYNEILTDSAFETHVLYNLAKRCGDRSCCSRDVTILRFFSSFHFHFYFILLKTIHSQQSQAETIHTELDSKATKHGQLPIS